MTYQASVPALTWFEASAQHLFACSQHDWIRHEGDPFLLGEQFHLVLVKGCLLEAQPCFPAT